MKKTKRFLSLFLSAVMLVTALCGLGVTAQAASAKNIYYSGINHYLNVFDGKVNGSETGIYSYQKGIFSAVVKDFNKDGKQELLTLSFGHRWGEKEGTIYATPFRIIDGAVYYASEDIPICNSGGGNWGYACDVFLDGNKIYVHNDCYSFGGTTCNSTYEIYSVTKSYELKKEKCYSVYDSNGSNNIHIYSEKVKGTKYKSEKDLMKVVDKTPFKNHKSCYKNKKHIGSHIAYVQLSNCDGSEAETNGGYGCKVYDNTNLRANLKQYGHLIKKSNIKPATAKSNGSYHGECTVCSHSAKYTVYKPAEFTFASTTYNGKNKRPSLTIKDSKGKKISSSYYTVTYQKKSVKVGKYTAKVKFKGLYSGTKTVSYTVKPKGTSITKLTSGKRKFTAKIAKQKTQTTGYEIQYSTSKKFKGAKKVTLKNSATSKTVKKLKRSKKYYVRVRTYKKVGKTTCYSSWSKTKTIKIK